MNLDNVLLAFGLTLVAGLSTGIGSCIALFAKRTDTRFLSVALGFSAGVMIYVSMVDIFFTAQESLVNELGKSLGSWVTVISFFAGIALIALIDRLVPSEENPMSTGKWKKLAVPSPFPAKSNSCVQACLLRWQLQYITFRKE